MLFLDIGDSFFVGNLRLCFAGLSLFFGGEQQARLDGGASERAERRRAFAIDLAIVPFVRVEGIDVCFLVFAIVIKLAEDLLAPTGDAVR